MSKIHTTTSNTCMRMYTHKFSMQNGSVLIMAHHSFFYFPVILKVWATDPRSLLYIFAIRYHCCKQTQTSCFLWQTRNLFYQEGLKKRKKRRWIYFLENMWQQPPLPHIGLLLPTHTHAQLALISVFKERKR